MTDFLSFFDTPASLSSYLANSVPGSCFAQLPFRQVVASAAGELNLPKGTS